MMKGTEAPAKSCNHAHMPCRAFRFSMIRALVRSRDVESLLSENDSPPGTWARHQISDIGILPSQQDTGTGRRLMDFLLIVHTYLRIIRHDCTI